ncbi:MAG: hypothetical protein AB8G05_18780 [Oligoflexales bacterium]
MLIPILISFMAISCGNRGKISSPSSNNVSSNANSKVDSNVRINKDINNPGSESNTITSLRKISFSSPVEDQVSVDRVVEVSWTSLEENNILYESKLCTSNSCDGKCQDQFRSRLNKREIYLKSTIPQYVCVRGFLSAQDITSEWSISKKLSLHVAPQDILISDLATLDNTSEVNSMVGNLSANTTDNASIKFEIVKTTGTDFEYFTINNGNVIELSQSLSMLDVSKTVLTLEIMATDSQSQSLTKTFVFSVGAINTAPVNIELINNSILENQDSSLIGDFLVTDNAGDTHIFE